jgi:hypothetical protein
MTASILSRGVIDPGANLLALHSIDLLAFLYLVHIHQEQIC